MKTEFYRSRSVRAFAAPIHVAAVFSVALVPCLQAADYVKAYSRGGGSQLLAANGGAGYTLFVDQATIGGGDMVANGGNPTWGWEIDASSSWDLGDNVSFTGIAIPIWANSATTDATSNTQNATHRIRIYSCGENNSFDGTATDVLVGQVDVTFASAGAGVDEYFVNFDAPIEWANADSTSFYFYIQAIALSEGSGNAMRFKTGAPNASAAIKNRTNGNVQTVGGSTTTSLSVAGTVNEKSWYGNEIAGPADWDTSSSFWDQGTGTYSDGDVVVFDETFDGASSTVNLVGELVPEGVLVSNSAGGVVPEFVFSGAGALTGAMALSRDGDGSLTIGNTGANDYTGATNILGGMLKLGRADAISTSSSVMVGSSGSSAELVLDGYDQSIAGLISGGAPTDMITNGSSTPVTLTVENEVSNTYAAEIGNSGVATTDDDNKINLVKNGAGELILTGTNSYNGSTTINEGVIRIVADSGLGSAPMSLVADSIVLDGGVLRAHMASATGGSFEINANRLITLGVGGGEIRTTTPSGAWVVSYNGVISGTGSLNKSFAQTLELGGANDYEGDTLVTGGLLRVNGGAIPDGSPLVIDGGKVESTGTEVVESLFFGETQQAAGTWGATDSGAENIDDTRFAGISGVVSVTTGPPVGTYESWAMTNITDIDPTAPAGFDDDANGDGMDNGLKWILGGDPLAMNGPDLVTTVMDATHVTFTFERTDDSVGSSTLNFQWGTDLAGWNDVPVTSGNSTDPDGVKVDVTDGVGSDTVVVTLPRSLAVDGRLFSRLHATQP